MQAQDLVEANHSRRAHRLVRHVDAASVPGKSAGNSATTASGAVDVAAAAAAAASASNCAAGHADVDLVQGARGSIRHRRRPAFARAFLRARARTRARRACASASALRPRTGALGLVLQAEPQERRAYAGQGRPAKAESRKGLSRRTAAAAAVSSRGAARGRRRRGRRRRVGGAAHRAREHVQRQHTSRLHSAASSLQPHPWPHAPTHEPTHEPRPSRLQQHQRGLSGRRGRRVCHASREAGRRSGLSNAQQPAEGRGCISTVCSTGTPGGLRGTGT